MYHRRTGNVLLYDSRQQWFKQPEQQQPEQPVLLHPHLPCLLTNEVKASYVACESLLVSEFSVRGSTGLVHTYQVEK